MREKITVTFDGPRTSGKSSLAKVLGSLPNVISMKCTSAVKTKEVYEVVIDKSFNLNIDKFKEKLCQILN